MDEIQDMICWNQVSEVWRSYELDMINYQNKCRLIRGWDDLFTKVKEHINSVTAMKLSPYYKVCCCRLLSTDCWLLSIDCCPQTVSSCWVSLTFILNVHFHVKVQNIDFVHLLSCKIISSCYSSCFGYLFFQCKINHCIILKINIFVSSC